VQDLRQALEELDEALDRIEDHLAAHPVAANVNVIAPRSPFDIQRTEFARRLDATIIDAQKLLDQAA